MATSEPWDIPNPCHFEPCKKDSCGPCDAGNIFQHPVKTPGVPVGRVLVPLVRINGQIQDLNAGGYIGNQFIEPPKMSWDQSNGILNVGGRYVKLRTSAMLLSDCHGNTIDPCSNVLTCSNWAEIINASTGIVFKDPHNPFAGLIFKLPEDSGLIVDETGIHLDYEKICQRLKEMNCITEPMEPDPDPTPEPGGETIIRNGIPGYGCHAEDDSRLQYPVGNFTLTWVPNGSGSGVITVSPSGPTRFYRGSANAPVFLGTIADEFSESSFYDITRVSANSECAAPEPPTPDPDPGDPDPVPTPTYDLSPKTLPTNSTCGYAGGNLPVKYDNGVLRKASAGTWNTTTGANQNWTVNLHNQYHGIIASFSTGQGGNYPPGLSFVYNPSGGNDFIMNISEFEYDSLAYVTVTGCFLNTA